MLQKLTHEDFAERLEETFRLRYGEAEFVDLQLIEVSARSGATAGAREPFSIVFRGPAESHVPQGTYTIDNPTLGELALFVVPIGPDGKGMCYEAVFN